MDLAPSSELILNTHLPWSGRGARCVRRPPWLGGRGRPLRGLTSGAPPAPLLRVTPRRPWCRTRAPPRRSLLNHGQPCSLLQNEAHVTARPDAWRGAASAAARTPCPRRRRTWRRRWRGGRGRAAGEAREEGWCPMCRRRWWRREVGGGLLGSGGGVGSYGDGADMTGGAAHDNDKQRAT
jgi:hypothetical protein